VIEPQPRTPSSLPVVALVCSVIGLCFPPLLVVGVVLGIICLVQKKGSQALGLISVLMAALAVPIFGVLAAIAIPNFIKFQARSKQSEAKAYLKSAYTAQRAYFAENSTFDLHPATVGFSPEKGNRYLYAFSMQGQIDARPGDPTKEAVGIGIDSVRHPTESDSRALAAIPPELAQTVGIRGTCPDCQLTLVASGNIDNDSDYDVWSIASYDRPGAPAGVPFNDYSDLEH